MKTKRSSISFKITLIGIGIFGALFFLWAIPMIGQMITEAFPEFTHAYWPWLLLFWVTAIPCYLALILLWKIAKSVDTEDLFAVANSKRLRQVSLLAIIDCVIFGGGNLIFLFLNINHPSVLIASAFAIFIGIAFSSCMRVMAHIFMRGEMLQDESNLTI